MSARRYVGEGPNAPDVVGLEIEHDGTRTVAQIKLARLAGWTSYTAPLPGDLPEDFRVALLKWLDILPCMQSGCPHDPSQRP